MSIQNSTINTYYKSATEVKLLENDPKVVEYLRAVAKRESAKKDAIAEMVKLKVSRTEGQTEYREYRFADKMVELKITISHIGAKEAYDRTTKTLTIK